MTRAARPPLEIPQAWIYWQAGLFFAVILTGGAFLGGVAPRWLFVAVLAVSLVIPSRVAWRAWSAR